MTDKAILLVEDSTADAYLIQRAVKDCGQAIQLWATADGVEALQLLRKAHAVAPAATPALILIDLLLPKMSGIQLLTEIRQLPAYQATPIVILSRLEKEREAALCFRLGATGYVQKSSNFHAFFHSIKALVKHWLQ
jgi:two-component system, chemotaxis family, response regulator Rcp1